MSGQISNLRYREIDQEQTDLKHQTPLARCLRWGWLRNLLWHHGKRFERQARELGWRQHYVEPVASEDL